MPVTRTYKCDGSECGLEFRHFHSSSNEPYPKCPQCNDNPHWVPKSFSITGAKAKAIDFAQKMAEEDYGLSNMRDNQRQGDIAALAPSPVQSAERDQIMQAVSEQQQQITGARVAAEANGVTWNWQNGTPVSVPPGTPGPASVARAEGNDPIGQLHAAAKALGKNAIVGDVVGAATINGDVDHKREGTSVPL